jgi:hypothetical protein
MKRPEMPLGPRQPCPVRYCTAPDYPDTCELCFAGGTATHFYEDPDMLINPHRVGVCEKHILGRPAQPIPEDVRRKKGN